MKSTTKIYPLSDTEAYEINTKESIKLMGRTFYHLEGRRIVSFPEDDHREIIIDLKLESPSITIGGKMRKLRYGLPTWDGRIINIGGIRYEANPVFWCLQVAIKEAPYKGGRISRKIYKKITTITEAFQLRDENVVYEFQ